MKIIAEAMERHSAMGMEIFKKSLLLLLTGVAAGTLLLTLAYILPVNSENRRASLETIESEGWYPRASVTSASYEENFHLYLPDVLDGASDRIMLYMATDTTEGNPFVRAMNSYNEYSGAYSYYWHGYVSILRPLLLLFNYSELRIFNGICQFLLVLFLAFIIGKEKGIRYMLMLATSYLLLSPGALSMSLQFSWVFYIAYTGTIVLLLKRDYFSTRFRYLYLFMTLGLLTSYCDLLTYPLFTWGMPLVWWLIMAKAPESAVTRETAGKSVRAEALFYVKQVVFSGFSWIAGYAGMWIMKWVIATPALGENIFKTAVDEVFKLSGTLETETLHLSDRLKAAHTNWLHYEYKIYALLLLCWLVWWFCSSLKNGGYRTRKRYAFFLTGISSIVWYFTLATHTQTHHFFTYRILGVSILAFLAVALDGTQAVADNRKSGLPKDPGARSFRKKTCCIWAAAVLLSVPLMLFERDDTFVFNGYVEFKTLQVPDHTIVETEFTPAYNSIKRLDLGLECAGTQGEYEIILWDGNSQKYRQTVPIGDNANIQYGHYYNIAVKWNLNAQKNYRITIEAKDNNAPVYLWVTEDRQGPLAEYHNLSIDGKAVEGQLLSGISYHYLPTSKRTLLFFTLTWTGILMAALYTFAPEPSQHSKS